MRGWGGGRAEDPGNGRGSDRRWESVMGTGRALPVLTLPVPRMAPPLCLSLWVSADSQWPPQAPTILGSYTVSLFSCPFNFVASEAPSRICPVCA